MQVVVEGTTVLLPLQDEEEDWEIGTRGGGRPQRLGEFCASAVRGGMGEGQDRGLS